MPKFCQYMNCQNLGSSSYSGYCNEDHMKRGPEMNVLREIIYTHKGIATIKEARDQLACRPTSFSRCEECKALPHALNVYQAK